MEPVHTQSACGSRAGHGVHLLARWHGGDHSSRILRVVGLDASGAGQKVAFAELWQLALASGLSTLGPESRWENAECLTAIVRPYANALADEGQSSRVDLASLWFSFGRALQSGCRPQFQHTPTY